MKIKPIIFGVQGKSLTENEIGFLQKNNPLGIILFSRNIENPEQVRTLVSSIRETLEREDAPILLDQEGGRVSRLKEPFWRKPPAAAIFGIIAKENLEDAKKAVFLNAQMIGADMAALGINVDCAPVLDIPVAGAHSVIGNRAFSNDKKIVAELGKSMADGLMSAGIVPIMKHIPGHGRGNADSHLQLPIVKTSLTELEKTDFYPFKKMNKLSWAMTAHIVYTAIDPDNAATISPKVIEVIRQVIGFKGLLISDCITMKALNGTMAEKAAATFKAGVDLVIHSHGSLEEMQQVADISPYMTESQIALLIKSFHQTMANNSKAYSEIHGELHSIIHRYHLEETVGNLFDPTEQLHT
jgi:beta-N-acetylhexosaminidase